MSLSEFETIAHYFNSASLGFARDGVAIGIGDDGAVLNPPAGAAMSMSMDLLVEGIHFPKGADGFGVGSRSLAVNLSDLAAMAAQPLCFTLGLTLSTVEDSWLQGFSSGLALMAEKYNCPLVGGDLTRGPAGAPTVISIQVHGVHPNTAPVLRSTACVGDSVFITGSLGDGAAALRVLGLESHLAQLDQLDLNSVSDAQSEYFEAAYYQPEPRIDFAQAAAQYMTSCIDVSDGLVGDIGHILRASEVGADILINQFPYSEAVLNLFTEPGRQQAALFGGDEYELCFTAAKQDESTFLAIAAQCNLPVQRIGVITSGQELRVLDGAGDIVPITGQAYQHFG